MCCILSLILDSERACEIHELHIPRGDRYTVFSAIHIQYYMVLGFIKHIEQGSTLAFLFPDFGRKQAVNRLSLMPLFQICCKTIKFWLKASRSESSFKDTLQNKNPIVYAWPLGFYVSASQSEI